MFCDFLGRKLSDLSLNEETVFYIPLNSPIGGFCVQQFNVLHMYVRAVALLLDIVFQKQTRVLFHPLSNDTNTSLFQELQSQLLQHLSHASLWMSNWLFTNFVLMQSFEAHKAFVMVSIQLLQQKILIIFESNRQRLSTC